MRKIFLILVLILSLGFAGFADDQSAAQQKQAQSFKIKPKIYLSAISPFVIRAFSLTNYRVSLTLGLDMSLFQYGNFRFFAIGGGVRAYYHKVIGWHTYYYYDYPQQYYGEGWKFTFKPYLKFVPVKYRSAWLSEFLKIDSYLELGITHEGHIVLGATFGF